MLKDKTEVEAVCGITSLGRQRSDAADLLGRVRGHWGIENRLHYVRDETLGEDRCRVREGNGAQVLAALRNACVHLLTAYVPAAAAVLKQVRVDAKTNEHKAALRLLGVLPLAGKVVSGDAMFTHRDVAGAVRRGGGDYLLIVKDNQPELKAQIQAALHDDAAFPPLPA